MTLRPSMRLVPVLVLASVLAAPPVVVAFQEAPASATSLTKDEQRECLLAARVTRSRHTNKGVTSPLRFTLTDGRLTRDAVFQRIDDRRMQAQFARGGGEVNFVDTYLYNLAAYELAGMLDLDHMHRALPSVPDLQRCDGALFQRLRALDAGEVAERLKSYLTRFELDALLARRDLLVAHFEELIAAKGEAAVLY